MKYTQLLSLLFILFFVACKDAPERPEPMLDEGYEPTTTTTTATTPQINAAGTPTGGTVFHYICPNGCGGGDAAGTCSVCGSTYTHNQAFHSQGAATTTPTTPANPAITTSQQQPPTQTPEPAQNAAGVWHYTCTNGCEGGAGSAVACAGCGSILVHNAVYHQ